MKICFVLPGFSRQPIGGYKIVFEYANRLSNDGYQIQILFLNDHKLEKLKAPLKIKKLLINFTTLIEPRWFNLNKDIEKISSFSKNYLSIVSDCDIVFATGIQTVEIVNNNFQNAKKFYLIQGYENWETSDEYVLNSYKMGFINIVVSNWLKEIVDIYSAKKTILLKNPIDLNIYTCKVLQKDRKPYTIGLLYHTEKIKGFEYALKAIFEIKELYPSLEVEMFGMFPRPKDLPDWIHYKRGATQLDTVKIYNSVQVFLCASIEEGYGLTGLEAMACGACLVSTAYKGVLEYAVNDYNSLLSPIKDVNSLVNNVSKLFESLEERNRISNNGIKSLKSYSWDSAISIMETLIEKG